MIDKKTLLIHLVALEVRLFFKWSKKHPAVTMKSVEVAQLAN